MAMFSQSPEQLTAVQSARSFGAKANGAGLSADAVHATSRRWFNYVI